ncbi:MAG: ABC transporter permease subunit [Myxococcota bacterium]
MTQPVAVEQDEIFAVGYRKLPAERSRRWAPWPIARTALALALRKRSTKIAGAVCGMVVFGAAMALVTQVIIGRVSESVAQQGMGSMVGAAAKAVVGDTHEVLSSFIGSQLFFTAILLGTALGGLIADDRRTGAFELYFSRPLSRMDYAIGKLLAAAIVPATTIVLPFFLLWLGVVGTAPAGVSDELIGLVVPGLVTSLMATALLTTTIVGVSSVGERGRTVAVLYITLFVLLAGVGNGLSNAGYAWAGYLAPQQDLQTVADELLGVGGISMTASYLELRNATNASAWLSALALLGFTAAGLGVFFVQLRKRVVG